MSALAGAGMSEADMAAPAIFAAGASASEQLADDKLACPICLQPLLEPMITRCGHAFCAHCIGRALSLSPPELYQAEYRLECPLCRGQVGILQESPGLADAVTQRYGTDFADRRRQDADVPHHSFPKPERDGPGEQVMAALKQQGGYKTLELNVTLDLSSGGWESMPACLPELRCLRQLRVENNLLRSLEHLRRPALLALVAHHNQIQHLGKQLFGEARPTAKGAQTPPQSRAPFPIATKNSRLWTTTVTGTAVADGPLRTVELVGNDPQLGERLGHWRRVEHSAQEQDCEGDGTHLPRRRAGVLRWRMRSRKRPQGTSYSPAASRS
ncbi:hypothetical protein T492DRAFT_835752 [Pavlovales sp. CCMP2436]|nr:hypothetical protein T492DRAFT_835752 [Pavlovales sp. CCMP2436]